MKIMGREVVNHRYPYDGPVCFETIEDVYNCCSKEKYRAWCECREWAIDVGASDYGVISHTQFAFTFGAYYRDVDGNALFCRITASKFHIYPA